jgi:hypothetical protein
VGRARDDGRHERGGRHCARGRREARRNIASASRRSLHLRYLLGDLAAAGNLDPTNANWYRMHVENDDGSSGSTTWARLVIGDVR